ncbi:MAG: hypothetical protein ACQEP7_05465 [bacterium]
MSAPTNRRAVFDLGSNSTRFLLLEGSTGEFAPDQIIDREMVVTKLGEKVEETGKLKLARIDKVCSVLENFNSKIKKQGGKWQGAIATSACRRAANRELLFEKVEAITGVKPALIDGKREAYLTYRGVKKALPAVDTGTVIDVGGGSTEVIKFSGSGLEFARSLPVGVVTLREKYITADRWQANFEEPVRRDIQEKLPAGNRLPSPLVVVGGTGTTVSAYLRKLDKYNPGEVHGDIIGREEMLAMLVDFEGVKFADLKNKPIISDGREDVIVPGLLIIDEFMQLIGAESFTVSDLGILVGLLEEVENNE